MNSIAREILLARKAAQLGIGYGRHGIVKGVVEEYRQAYAHHDVFGMREQPDKILHGTVWHVGTEQVILQAIARDAQFRKAEDRNILALGFRNGINDILVVMLPVPEGSDSTPQHRL